MADTNDQIDLLNDPDFWLLLVLLRGKIEAALMVLLVRYFEEDFKLIQGWFASGAAPAGFWVQRQAGLQRIFTWSYQQHLTQIGGRIAARAGWTVGDPSTPGKPSGRGWWDPWSPERQKWAGARANQQAGMVVDHTRTRVEDVLARFRDEPSPRGPATDHIRLLTKGNADSRAWRVAITQNTQASSEAQQDTVQAFLDDSGASAIKGWSTSRDERVRQAHRNLQGVWVPMEADFLPNLAYPGDPRAPAALIVRCFLPHTRVIPVGEVKALFRSPWEGQVITLRTLKGNTLTGTLNHPILTRRGWVPLQEIQEGDQVSQPDRLDGVLSMEEAKIYRDPPSFQELWDSTSMVELVSLAGNFHGDLPAGNTDVKIVTPQGELQYSRDPLGFQEGQDFAFSSPDFGTRFRSGGGGSDLPFQGLGNPSGSLMGRPGEGFSFPRGGFSHPDLHGFGSIPSRDAHEVQDESNGAPFLHRESSGQGLYGFPTSEQVSYDLSVFTGLDGAAVESHDTVVSVDRSHYSGFVHNMETSSGIYLAEGIVSHNCRCVLRYRFS